MTRAKLSFGLLAAALAVLAGCASGPRRPSLPQAQVERALKTAAGEAQPSRIVAAEIAFARDAMEVGQWTAFRNFAAPGAILHGPGGGIDATSWLARQKDPSQAVKWGPRAIWMSCDAKLAVSEGRYLEPDGTVGTFVTLWQRQDDDTYLWLYDAGTPDNPQPPPPGPDGALEENAIVVTALDSIQGLVADCRGTAPPLPADMASRRATMTGWTSPDGTLSFLWETAGGRRHLIADWLYEGRWQTALEHAWPANAPTPTE